MEVPIEPDSIQRLASMIAPDRSAELGLLADRARQVLAGRTVWNINSTARGGGVAEMLQTLLGYGRGAGVDTRWLVLDGDPEFFAMTKRLHNWLHGDPGDGGPLGDREGAHYRAVMTRNQSWVIGLIRRGDIVMLHDPQTAGLVDGLKSAGAVVVWRCHIGSDTSNSYTEQGWNFLRPLVQKADAFVFSRASYAPAWVPTSRLAMIAPSIDPFSSKNESLDVAEVRDILRRAGLLVGRTDAEPPGSHPPGDQRPAVRARRDLIVEGAPISFDDRLVVQVSRWDRLKDMAGVLTGFAAVETPDDVHLMLVGPDLGGVTDDPEGAAVLQECRDIWRTLPTAVRSRVHLVCLPMDDVRENALMVNAIQRHAAVVVQKSLAEGFGLTVTEALWKSRPVIAGAVGGIRDQITDGQQGTLLSDPHDLAAFGVALRRMLADPEGAARQGAVGHERVRDHYLPDRHLRQFLDLFTDLMTPTSGGRLNPPVDTAPPPPGRRPDLT